MKVIRRQPDKGYLDSALWVPKQFLNIEGVKNSLTFEIGAREREEPLELFVESTHHLQVPRAFFHALEDLGFPIVDCRPTSFVSTNISSHIKLDHKLDEHGKLVPTGSSLQRDALQVLLASEGGILQLACGKGKTIVALELIARAQVPAIVVIDNTYLLNQWIREAERWLHIPGGIGMLMGAKNTWQRGLVFTTYQTLASRARTLPEEVRRWFGLVIWDEAHHVGAPTFSLSADLFYGKRIGLTATPDRDDGLNVIYDFHIGPVLYKDLKQELVPDIEFRWTGLSLLDVHSDTVKELVLDKHNEIHFGKLAAFLGQWKKRTDLVLDLVEQKVAEDRKILVLSRSESALVNLLTLWNNRQATHLYSDIPFPTAAELKLKVTPRLLDDQRLAYVVGTLKLDKQLLTTTTGRSTRKEVKTRIKALEEMLAAHEAHMTLEQEYRRRQRHYVREVVKQPSNAGLMIHKVSTQDRDKMLKEKQVVFAVSKYGKEGLDDSSLDTIIAFEPIAKRGGLQQFMGRVLRRKHGKRKPLVIFMEDNIGPVIGICVKLRKFLRTWPIDEGGPYTYQMIGYPKRGKKHVG